MAKSAGLWHEFVVFDTVFLINKKFLCVSNDEYRSCVLWILHKLIDNQFTNFNAPENVKTDSSKIKYKFCSKKRILIKDAIVIKTKVKKAKIPPKNRGYF